MYKDVEGLTSHDTTVERTLADGDDNIRADTFKNFAPADEEAIGMLEAFRVLLPIGLSQLALVERLHAVRVLRLADDVALARRAGLVAAHVVPAEEDAVAGDDLAGLEERDVADDDGVHADAARDARADDGDRALVLLRAQHAELALFLPVRERADEDDDGDRDHDCHAFDPLDGRLVWLAPGAEVLEEPQGEGDD